MLANKLIALALVIGAHPVVLNFRRQAFERLLVLLAPDPDIPEGVVDRLLMYRKPAHGVAAQAARLLQAVVARFFTGAGHEHPEGVVLLAVARLPVLAEKSAREVVFAVALEFALDPFECHRAPVHLQEEVLESSALLQDDQAIRADGNVVLLPALHLGIVHPVVIGRPLAEVVELHRFPALARHRERHLEVVEIQFVALEEVAAPVAVLVPGNLLRRNHPLLQQQFLAFMGQAVDGGTAPEGHRQKLALEVARVPQLLQPLLRHLVRGKEELCQLLGGQKAVLHHLADDEQVALLQLQVARPLPLRAVHALLAFGRCGGGHSVCRLNGVFPIFSLILAAFYPLRLPGNRTGGAGGTISGSTTGVTAALAWGICRGGGDAVTAGSR